MQLTISVMGTSRGLRPRLLALLAAANCHGYILGGPAARGALSRAGRPVTLYAVEEGESLAEADNEPSEMALSEDGLTVLEESDLLNTRWQVTFTPREDSWVKGGVQQQEFALLEGGSVVWAGQAGGFGTGGRWQLSGETLEVIRTTPLGLLTGRDYYMSIVRARVTDDLQFEVQGITRSYDRMAKVAVFVGSQLGTTTGSPLIGSEGSRLLYAPRRRGLTHTLHPTERPWPLF